MKLKLVGMNSSDSLTLWASSNNRAEMSFDPIKS